MKTKEDISESILPLEVRERIRDTAVKLLGIVLDEVGNNPMHGMATLLLAAGTACAWGKVNYDDMVSLLSTYYENQLLQEAEQELKAADTGLVLKKPQGFQ